MKWTSVCINQNVISKHQSNKKIFLVHAMTAWKNKPSGSHPYQLQSPGLLQFLDIPWTGVTDQACFWSLPLLTLIDQVLHLSVFVSLPFLILPAEKINFLTLLMSLPISVTDQDCSHHYLPYYVSGRFVSACSCLRLLWPAALKGADALLPWPLHSVIVNRRAPVTMPIYWSPECFEAPWFILFSTVRNFSWKHVRIFSSLLSIT